MLTQAMRREYGAVFTKTWMVEFMLDICGYDADLDLAHMVLVEPSCGEGSFLLPAVERLSASCRNFGLDISEASGAIRAYDLRMENVLASRRAVTRWLVEDGWPVSTAHHLADEWVQQSDYLLSNQPENSVDFVVGNPPYIRAEMIPRERRLQYLERCTTMTEGTDIYVGFIEKGLRSLKPTGKLCFICADRWMHNAYGRRLRKLIAEQFAVNAVFKMHGVDAFADEVSAYPAVVLLSRGPQGPVRYASARPEFDVVDAEALRAWTENGMRPKSHPAFSAAVIPKWFPTDDHWPAGSPARLELLEELEARFPALEATGAKVGIGIATGADSVFVTSDSEVVEPSRLLPLVRTSDIRAGRVSWQGCWLVNPWDDDNRLVDLEQFPRLKEYLGARRNVLEARHVARKAPDQWYRTIDRIVPGLQNTPKLLLPDIKARIEPALDDGRYYPHHNLYWITPGEWDIRVLGGLLLSRVAEFFVSCYAVRMRGETLRFQAQYLRKIRVPHPYNIPEEISERLAKAFSLRDVQAATIAAQEVYGISSLPE